MAGYGPMARAYERQQQQPTAPLDEIDKLEQVRKSLPPSSIPGWAEPLVTAGTGLAGSAVGGRAALGTIPANMLGLSGSSPADVLSSIQQRMTYLPRTVEGMGALYGLGKAAEAMHAPVARAAGAVLEATGSPAAATAVDVGPAALGAIAGLPFGPGRTAVNAARAAIPDVAPSAPGLGPGIAGQRGTIGPAQLMVDQATLRRALAMQAAGRGSFGIFGDTNVWLNSPGTETPRGMPLAEISDPLLSAQPKNIATPPDPVQVERLNSAMSDLDARYLYAEARQGGMTHAEAMALLKERGSPPIWVDPQRPPTTGEIVNRMNVLSWEVNNLNKPKYGNKLGDVIEHPELFSRMPRLRDVNFRAEPLERFAGDYNPDKDRIRLNTNYMDSGPLSTGQTLIHEVGHAAQRHYGMPGGANPKSARTRMLEAQRAGNIDDDLFGLLNRMNSDDLYYRAWGEGLSNAAMQALGWSDQARKDTPPWARMTDARGNAIPPNQFWIPPR